MAFGLGRWRPRHLLMGWGIYWALLACFTLGSGALAVWRMTRPDRHGSVSASFDDGLLRVSVIGDGVTAWSGSADLGTLALWIAGPPLLLWLAWLASRPRRDGVPAGVSTSLIEGEGSALTDGRVTAAGALNRPAAEPLAPARSGRPVEHERRGRGI
jgi:hypothetical protein